jgi:hypothetical protein
MSIHTTTPTLGSAPRVVDRTLAAITPFAATSHEGLTLTPLGLTVPGRERDYLDFDEARQRDEIVIQEAPAHTVPFVEATTKDHLVLLLGGDTLLGGAQNRVINVTILLKAKATSRIPVSCLQAGRWDHGQRFTSGRQADLSMRSRMTRHVAEREAVRAASQPAFLANQSDIWAEIGRKQMRAGFHSPTSALHEVYQAELPDLEAVVRAFPPPAVGARGVAVGIDDRIVGLDLFDSGETLDRQWPRLLEGYGSALLDHRRAVAREMTPKPKSHHPDDGALGRMVARARASLGEAVVQPSVSAGRDVRFVGEKVHGSALVYEDRVIHLAVFRGDPLSTERGPR